MILLKFLLVFWAVQMVGFGLLVALSWLRSVRIVLR